MIPAPRALVSSLIPSLRHGPNDNKPLDDPSNKTLLLTLHALFPTVLLPALDLLDRDLVTLLQHRQPSNSPVDATVVVYHVDSALQHHHHHHHHQQSRHHHHHHNNNNSNRPETRRRHEVRLEAWTCSCPAFALSAFPLGPSSTETEAEADDGMAPAAGCAFGGLAIARSPPVCKHLLACALAGSGGGGGGGGVRRREDVGRDEVAGWAAGWEGD